MSIITEIECLTYVPHGKGAANDSLFEQTRKIRNYVKNGRKDIIIKAVSLDIEGKSLITHYIGTDSLLVPIPRSSPITNGFVWPSLEICIALKELGLGKEVAQILQRDYKVKKSSLSTSAEDRLSVDEHFKSMSINTNLLFQPETVVLVDDVVTQGRTLMAVYRHVNNIFPESCIKSFTPIRSLFASAPYNKTFDPHISRIEYFSSGKTFVHH